jgi:hypothetical protein
MSSRYVKVGSLHYRSGKITLITTVDVGDEKNMEPFINWMCLILRG